MTYTTKQSTNIRDLEELAGHAADIFWSEEKNKGNIHLHKFRIYWVAFEKSAYFIQNIFGNRDLIVWGIERSGFFNGREKWAKGFENQRV